MSCRNAPRLHSFAIQPELGRHHPGDVRRLDQVLQHVLPVRRPVPQQAHRPDQLRVQVGDPDLRHRVLGGPLAQLGHLALAAFVDLLDPARVDPPVEYQRIQRQPRGLPAYRIEAGQQHRLRGVVDDQVDAGGLLERPDVAALAADDPALHVVARQVHHRHDRLAGLLRRQPLHRAGDDLAGLRLALVQRLPLDVADDRVRVPLRLRLDRRDQLGLRLLGGEVRDALQDPAALVLEVADLGLAAIQLGQLRGQLGLAFLDRAVLLVEPFLALGQPVLAALHLEALLAQIVPDRLRLGLGFAPYVGRPLLGLPPYLGRPVLRGAADLLGPLLGGLGPDPQYGGLLLGLATDRARPPTWRRRRWWRPRVARSAAAAELLGGFPAGEGEADPGQQPGDQQSDQGQPETSTWQAASDIGVSPLSSPAPGGTLWSVEGIRHAYEPTDGTADRTTGVRRCRSVASRSAARPPSVEPPADRFGCTSPRHGAHAPPPSNRAVPSIRRRCESPSSVLQLGRACSCLLSGRSAGDQPACRCYTRHRQVE